MSKRNWSFMIALGLASCVPSHLQKYRRDPGIDQDAKAMSEIPPPTAAADVQSRGNAPLVMDPIDKQTFRFHAGEALVWEAALGVLVRDYNLTVVDRTSGLMTTEWDSSASPDAPRRNKISLLIRRTSWQSVEVTIHNSEEVFGTGVNEGIWSKAGDGSAETLRVAKNIALRLGAPATGEISAKESEESRPPL